MATRKTTQQAPRSVLDPKLGAKVRASAQDIWMAGLGAFAKAQDDGSRLFESLVTEGRFLQDKLVSSAGAVKGKLGDVGIANMTDRLSDGMGRIGQLVEGSTSTVLNKAGLATRQEVDSLSRRVSKLAKEVEKLSAASKPMAGVRSAGRAAKAANKRT